MAIYSLGSTWSRVYTLVGPDGTRAVFNDPLDPDYVGWLDPGRCSGLDGTLVRGGTEDIVSFDGATYNPGFFGARPVILAGEIHAATIAARDAQESRLRRARNALRSEARLSWVQSDGIAQYLDLRLNDRAETGGAWVKSFQVPMIAADPRVYSAEVHIAESGALSGAATGRTYPLSYGKNFGNAAYTFALEVNNAGDAETFPVLRAFGQGADIYLDNLRSGRSIKVDLSIAAGSWIAIDTLNRTALLDDTASYYQNIDFVNTDWWGLLPGLNPIQVRFGSYSGSARLQATWRDAWL